MIDLDYADTIIRLAPNSNSAQQMLDEAVHFSFYFSLQINVKKTKVLDLNVTIEYQPTLNGFHLEKDYDFVYLGSTVDSN